MKPLNPEADFEAMVRWSLANPSTRRSGHAGRPAIEEHFGVGSGVAQRVAREAAGRVRTGHQAAQAEAGTDSPAAGLTYEEGEDRARLVTVSREIRSVEDALAYGKVDMERWEVARSKINSWEQASKDASGAIQVTPLWQVTVHLKPRMVTGVEQALEALVARVPAAPAPRYEPLSREGERKVEVALYDLHFGLLAWAPETGENYDVTIARRIMGDAVAQIAERTRGLGVAGYMLPIGNDLFHVNDPTGLTPMSKNRLDVDSRLPKIFSEARLALCSAVEVLAEIAPVELIWVPGNHDPQTSYWMLQVLAARYAGNERVTVDTSPKPRKVWRYGINLLWLLHGCDLAQKNEKALPGLFASEAAGLWAPGQYREVHRGHTHKKNELWFTAAETYGGVVVRTIPSLVATDDWHFRKGFVETSKTAQFFVWNREYGLESVQDVHVARSFYTGGGVANPATTVAEGTTPVGADK